MIRHPHADESAPPKDRGTADLPMFAQAPEPPRQSETYTQAQRNADVRAWLETLVPLARELARKSGAHGVTVSDVRITAVNRGLMTDEESRTRGSALGQLMKMAGLVETPEFRRSSIGRSHSNNHRVWVAPEFARAA